MAAGMQSFIDLAQSQRQNATPRKATEKSPQISDYYINTRFFCIKLLYINWFGFWRRYVKY